MPYVIELISIGGDFYPVLKSAATQLNGLQEEFQFRLTSEGHRKDALEFRNDSYISTDIWEFLKGQRNKYGGNRSYIIAFINAPLKSLSLGNLFGSHEASNGLAAVTLHNRAQYVREEKLYCCYYLIRYALSFVNPTIKSHNDPARAFCYFHQKKDDKREIRVSMNSGRLCDVCSKQLDNPPNDGVCKKPSADELEALRTMRTFVAGEYPYAVVMKGGGVKGLAFASALVELEKYFWFDRHVGTSAGAIAAILLAANYSPADLVGILQQKDFRQFMDARLWKIPFNLLFKNGLFPGEHFRTWIAGLIGTKSGKMAETKMSDLNGALLYASRWGTGTVIFDSSGERKDTVAAFAARCSMSIPIFFFPQMVDGRRAFDGGMRNNFPLKKFLEDHPWKPFVALYLGKRDDRNKRWLGSELLDIWMDGEERQTVDQHKSNVVVIDTSPIGTVDFRLNESEKQFLLNVGKAAALRFLRDRKVEDGPDEQTVQSAEQAAESSRTQVRKSRNRRRLWSFLIVVVVAVVFYFIAPKIWSTISTLWAALHK